MEDRRMIRAASIALVLAFGSAARGDGYRHVGDFLLQSHFKLTDGKITPIPIKSVVFRVFTDGTRVRISADDEGEAGSTFEIYRSDGIGRQRGGRGALEVIPGVQATCQTGGVFRHLRLSRDSLTITTFPGVSDQTIVSHAVPAERKTTAGKEDSATGPPAETAADLPAELLADPATP